MDFLRIDAMAIGPWPPPLCFYDLSPADGLHASSIQNDAIAKLCQEYPHRFAGLGTVPLQDIKLAVRELKRIVEELHLYGVEILTNVHGVPTGSLRFEDFWEAVASLNITVFIHPTPAEYSPSALQEFYLGNLIELPLQTGLNAAHIIFNGYLERYPDLKVVLAHGGGVMPWLLGRWEHGYKVRPEPKVCLKKSPVESARKFYLDTITHDINMLEYLVKTFSADHILLGSDYPFDMGPEFPVRVVENLSISDEDKTKILAGNAVRLLGFTGLERDERI